MSTVTFPEGIKTFKPNEKAPSFVKANLVINKTELLAWLSSQGETVRLDVLESKTGDKYYLSVNDFTPAQKDSMHSEAEQKKRVAIESDDLPF